MLLVTVIEQFFQFVYEVLTIATITLQIFFSKKQHGNVNVILILHCRIFGNSQITDLYIDTDKTQDNLRLLTQHRFSFTI